jgi:broad specificity phosphatase PhoE
MRLLLIRHGESEGNAAGRIQGIVDEPLSKVGKAQALALATRLRLESSLSGVYSSGLRRALETAEPIAAVFHLPIVTHADLREYDLGALTGLSLGQVEARYPDLVKAWSESPLWVPIPGEEGREAYFRRVMAAMDWVVARHADEDTIAVVAHGGTWGAYLCGVLGMDSCSRRFPWTFDNASLSIVELDAAHPRVLLLNDTCHLNHLSGEGES